MDDEELDEELENQIWRARTEVESALTDLAQSTVPDTMIYEYLFLVKGIMRIYDEYTRAMDNEDAKTVLIKASRIVAKIRREKKTGILSFTN